MSRLRSLAIICFVSAIVGSLASAQTKPIDKAAPTNIYKRTLKSCVWVFQPQGGGRYRTGSGTLIDVKDRLIITNYHVVGDEKTASVAFPMFEKNGDTVKEREAYLSKAQGGKVPNAKVLASSPKQDLALLQLVQADGIPKDTPAIRLAKDAVGPAETIHCIGNSGASAGLFDYCKGDVRNVAKRSGTPKGADPPFKLEAKIIEHTAPVNKGQSGGPVFNEAGELVGVTQGHLEEARAVSLAIDITEVKEFLKANKYSRLLNVPAPAVTIAAADAPSPDADPKAEAARKESTANGKLVLAMDLYNANKMDKAKQRFEDIVKDFPDTKAATEAKKMLDKIK